MWGISGLAEDLLVSEEGLCCMELVILFLNCIGYIVSSECGRR